MRKEYDFSNAKRAQELPHLAKLQAENTDKTPITIFLNDDILAEFRERVTKSGKGYPVYSERRYSVAVDAK